MKLQLLQIGVTIHDHIYGIDLLKYYSLGILLAHDWKPRAAREVHFEVENRKTRENPLYFPYAKHKENPLEFIKFVEDRLRIDENNKIFEKERRGRRRFFKQGEYPENKSKIWPKIPAKEYPPPMFHLWKIGGP